MQVNSDAAQERRPKHGRLLLIGGIILSWFVGAVIVRVGLDWSDTFDYSPASEWRYLGVAILATVTALFGTIATIITYRSLRNRS